MTTSAIGSQTVKSSGKSESFKPALLLAVALGVFFLIVFLSLRTNAYLSVDGALRCLNIPFSGQRYQTNNHMLYPFWIRMWANANGLIGLHASDAFQYIRMSQAMNAFFAASCVAFLFHLINLIAGPKGALLGSLMFGFSTALTAHATNSAEVLPGLFFALLALVLLSQGILHASRILLVVAGATLALALASYEAMGTAAGIAALMCYFWPVASDNAKKISFVGRLATVAAGGVAGVLLIYGLAYADQGISLRAMPGRLASMDGQTEVYGGFHLSKVVNFPFGFVQTFFPALPLGYNGVRSFFHRPDGMVWLAVAGSGLLLLGCIGWFTVQAWRKLARPMRPGPLAIVVGGSALLVFPLIYWSSLYDKLWLLPLVFLCFAIGVALRDGLLHKKSAQLMTILLLGCIFVEIAANVPHLILVHTRPTPHLQEARELAGKVNASDWVVLDFDDVSALWMQIWGQKARTLLLPAESTEVATRWLSEAKTACRQSGGRILFVSVLTESRSSWDAFLGSKARIPFELLDEYRAGAVPLMSWNFDGVEGSVSQYKPN